MTTLLIVSVHFYLAMNEANLVMTTFIISSACPSLFLSSLVVQSLEAGRVVVLVASRTLRFLG